MEWFLVGEGPRKGCRIVAIEESVRLEQSRCWWEDTRRWERGRAGKHKTDEKEMEMGSRGHLRSFL